ncbi:MAG: hypothetical protein ACFCUU_09045 [Cyclobacteriaceae bacterium]
MLYLGKNELWSKTCKVGAKIHKNTKALALFFDRKPKYLELIDFEMLTPLHDKMSPNWL